MQKTKEQHSDIESGRYVIAREIEGLQALNDALGSEFQRVVELIAGLKGRLIVSGMGKSGHVARKIAATMASTGTPAYFVHPSEASHGDLGMITEDDAVLALSNSGETAELKDMIAYTRRFHIPLIALVRRDTSMLVESADIAVVLPEIPEASPTGAPTTSTIMMMAFGDALAIALLERRGFGPEEFQVFHPGGKLGKTFMRVSDLMHQGEELPLVTPDATMDKVLIEITAKRLGCAGVVDEQGKLAGIITDGDLRRHMGADLLTQTAEKLMSRTPITIAPKALAIEAVALMNEKSITCLFAVEGGKPAGVIHLHDCLRAGVV